MSLTNWEEFVEDINKVNFKSGDDFDPNEIFGKDVSGAAGSDIDPTLKELYSLYMNIMERIAPQYFSKALPGTEVIPQVTERDNYDRAQINRTGRDNTEKGEKYLKRSRIGFNDFVNKKGDSYVKKYLDKYFRYALNSNIQQPAPPQVSSILGISPGGSGFLGGELGYSFHNPYTYTPPITNTKRGIPRYSYTPPYIPQSGNTYGLLSGFNSYPSNNLYSNDGLNFSSYANTSTKPKKQTKIGLLSSQGALTGILPKL